MLVLQELLDHLEGMLSNEAVEVSGGQSIVEVKPQVGARLGLAACAGAWQILQGAVLPWTQASSCCATHLSKNRIQEACQVSAPPVRTTAPEDPMPWLSLDCCPLLIKAASSALCMPHRLALHAAAGSS